MHRLTACASFASLAMLATSPVDADTLYRFSGGRLFDGAYGPVAVAQARLRTELAACGGPVVVRVDGAFDARTRDALAALSRCPKFASALATDPDARSGVLTTGYWAALVGGGQAPGIDARARTLMLTYEATDYVRAEWNFCQSKPVYDPAAGRTKCFSNDPHSYITWGPNGATAGNGREVQLILQALDAARPGLVDTGFGTEAAAVRRMFSMPDRTAARALETYLCGVWATPARRQAWRAGFDSIGRSDLTRETYDSLYASRSLDGGKIATFYRAYAARGLVPTEVDYAFFKDRAAHTTPVQGPVEAAIGSALAAGPVARWRVRRAIALQVRPGNQREDRLGRDVAFFIDGATEGGVSAEELSAWRRRGALRASDAGLSDDRTIPNYTPGPAIPTSIASPAALTPEERAACPSAVLATAKPPARASR